MRDGTLAGAGWTRAGGSGRCRSYPAGGPAPGGAAPARAAHQPGSVELTERRQRPATRRAGWVAFPVLPAAGVGCRPPRSRRSPAAWHPRE